MKARTRRPSNCRPSDSARSRSAPFPWRSSQDSPFADTFTVELANGWNGYLPTPEQHELGGYETWLGTNFVQKDASQKITGELLDMLKELQPAH
jgi:hypothetical protein